MRFTSSSTARLRVASAASRSAGGPQIPVPVIRIAPYPMRLTVRSPSLIVPAAAAEIRFPITLILSSFFEMTEVSPTQRIFLGCNFRVTLAEALFNLKRDILQDRLTFHFQGHRIPRLHARELLP